jgi:hypothetical protein
VYRIQPGWNTFAHDFITCSQIAGFPACAWQPEYAVETVPFLGARMAATFLEGSGLYRT